MTITSTNGGSGVKAKSWADPDDAPEWSEDVFDRAEIRDGDTVIRPAKGTLTKGEGV